MQKPLIIAQAETNPIIANQIIEEVGPKIQTMILAYSTKALNRYSLKPGRIFGQKNGVGRYRIIELSGNVIVYKDLNQDKIEYKGITQLLEDWNAQNIVEIVPVDTILQKIKTLLTPFLGGVLVAGLLSWLLKKLGR